jgi:meso-butanediol dehydrogenase/(S,S)-butanediol dehydrogenase/diacetyl reductase
MRFENKVAVITGGASGIGAATARLLALEGAHVVIGDLQTDIGSVLAGEIGGDFVHVDVSERAQVEALVAHAADTHGGLDILFNNAGIGSFGETPDLDPEDWRRVFAGRSRRGVLRLPRRHPLMRARGGGAIVNTASISGLGGDYGFSAYNAAKGALVNYTRTLAGRPRQGRHPRQRALPRLHRHAAGRPLKAIPGLVDAWLPQIPLQRPAARGDGQGRRLPGLDDASYVTGTIMVADGGMTARTGQPNFVGLAGAALAAGAPT